MFWKNKSEDIMEEAEKELSDALDQQKMAIQKQQLATDTLDKVRSKLDLLIKDLKTVNE